MNIGKYIAEFRTNCDLTQEELAAKVGVSRQAVTKWESDESTPELSKLVAMADVFDVSLDRLVGRDKTVLDDFKESLIKVYRSEIKKRDFELSAPLLIKLIELSELNGESATDILKTIKDLADAEE